MKHRFADEITLVRVTIPLGPAVIANILHPRTALSRPTSFSSPIFGEAVVEGIVSMPYTWRTGGADSFDREPRPHPTGHFHDPGNHHTGDHQRPADGVRLCPDRGRSEPDLRADGDRQFRARRIHDAGHVRGFLAMVPVRPGPPFVPAHLRRPSVLSRRRHPLRDHSPYSQRLHAGADLRHLRTGDFPARLGPVSVDP